jgi:uncharacterized membrane protein YgaE (UPF0421/DUF939 family)
LRNQGNSFEPKGKTDHYTKDIENTINNMKKELYETYDKKKEEINPKTKTKNKENSYKSAQEIKYVNDDDQYKIALNRQSELKVTKTNSTR